jgi:folate-binding Fe-S cluster repair protein YgfZ
MSKGCYRGQETVAKIFNLGAPPRRLVMLHLDGSAVVFPAQGTPVENNGVQVGFLGTVARHHELGPIALALIKRSTPTDAVLTVDGISAAQEVIVSGSR